MKIAASLIALAAARPSEKILGGEDAKDGMFPWGVSLQRQTGSHFCGGSILSADFVMCACHCKQTATFYINAGSVLRSSPAQKISTNTFICHPSYNSQRIDWDYAVIKASEKFDFDTHSAVMSPIPLVAPNAAEVTSGTPLETSGWGYYKRNSLGQPITIPENMQWASLHAITVAECARVWGSQTLGDQQQCAEEDGMSSCMGDSGGPLTMMEGGVKVLLGNVSWGHSRCSEVGFPACYSRNRDPTANQWIRTNAELL